MRDQILTQSYTSANSFPGKVLKCQRAQSLLPVHVQWLPTNLCNFNCSFCSCRNRDRHQSMPLEQAKQVIYAFATCGMQAVTITGGGEPLCHPDLPAMISWFSELGIKIGLVTNGALLQRVSHNTLSMLTWCRISNSDSRELTSDYRATLDYATEVPIDWAFSHVVSGTPNLPEIHRIIDYATAHEFTHVRLVADLLQPETVDWGSVYESLSGMDQRVIYQERKQSTPATKCWLGYIKPVVAPDFDMYLCCGAQYAINGQTGYFPDALRMGSALDLPAIYNTPRLPFTVPCDRCYYPEYNELLAAYAVELQHQEFL